MEGIEIINSGYLLAFNETGAYYIPIVFTTLRKPAILHMSERRLRFLDGAIQVHRWAWQFHIQQFSAFLLQDQQCCLPRFAYLWIKWINKIILWHADLESLQ